MKYGVTAASGSLGREVVRALASKVGSASVVGLARTPEKARDLPVEVRQGDYDQPDQLVSSLAGVDAVLLISGMAAPRDRIQQHRNVIDAARAAGVQKLVYTSIQGMEEGTGFSPVVMSNRQTEADVRGSGLAWAIGRNGIYIEPDVEYLPTYVARGEIANCAGDARCGYTTRADLARAYVHLLTEEHGEGRTYRLHGEPITQTELAAHLNRTFGTSLRYRSMSVEAYRADRERELGPFLGGIIAGIYEGIRHGALDVESDFDEAAARPHRSWDAFFAALGEREG